MFKFILGFILGLIIMYFWLNTSNYSNMKFISDKLLRQSSRYAIAAKQDESPLISLLHANYAAGYLFALKDILGDYNPDIDMLKFEAEITKIQDNTTKKVLNICPNFASSLAEDTYLLKISQDILYKKN